MENKAVILNKYESIERCINRINEEYQNDFSNLNNFTKEDAIILNLQRACEQVIDIAMYIVSSRKLGLPQSKKNAFEILLKNNLISEDMFEKMKRMIRLRNVAIYDYQEIDDEILIDVIENHLDDLKEFAIEMLKLE